MTVPGRRSAALFVSDLHIDAAHPSIARRFLEFLARDARDATALYVLGDLFESWVGDDDPDDAQRSVIAALRDLTGRGVPCFVMHGNRDFLIGGRFAAASGATLLADPVLLTLYGERALVMHGDALCTGDRAYQRLRATVRDTGWQRRFLALPVAARRALADAARAGSQTQNAALAPAIADVDADSVAAVLRAADVGTLIHGHTHRPGIHRFDVDGIARTRIVLGDWYDTGTALRWDAGGFELVRLG